tara:strand:+ start:104 stop:442 length:339 start_codon:yes stop_codon:yes gene_type:complete
MKPRMITTPTNFNETQIKVKNLQENIIKQAKDTLGEENVTESFVKNLSNALQNVSDNQLKSAELTKNFELGIENDLTKVMIQQQLSGLGFQMTLNVRNKVLSAYKDIMNMPV